MEKELEYKLVNNTSNTVIGNVWWDGKKVGASNTKAMGLIKHAVINGLTIDDGREFLESLHFHFKSGYITARKVNS